MEASSSATGIGDLPGYPVTAIMIPQTGNGGILATLYVVRAKAAAAAVALSLAAGGFTAVSSSFMSESPAVNPGLVAATDKAPRARVLEPKPAAVAKPEPVEAPKAEANLKAKEDRLASLEAAAAKMEAMLSSQEKPKAEAIPVPRAEIKVTSEARSGFWRSSGKDEEDFVIVESFGADGSPVNVPVTDMDTGETREVSRWAVRVTPEEFSRLSAEKAVSGSIAGMAAGVREEGSEDVDWKISVSGGALVEWKEDAQ